MGSGKSSGSSQAVLSDEQKEQVKAQTGLLKDTLIPAYQNTIKGAEANYTEANPFLVSAAKEGYKTAGDVATDATSGGTSMINTGSTGLSSLFDKDYEANQVNAALQTGKEAAREAYGANNASMGAAGQLGSARAALASRNLESLDKQRQSTAAAGAQAGVQANKAAAANSLITGGGSYLNTGLGAAGQKVNMANAPMDLYQKYASVVYGTPGSSGGNFQGTQGQNTSGKSSGFKL